MIGDRHVAQCSFAGRPVFLHYGIEVHGGAIVERTRLHGCRLLASHAAFARRRRTWIEPSDATMLEREQIALRAESMVGRHDYSLLRNNCEHLVNLCTVGQPYSGQVNVTVRRGTGVGLMLTGAVLGCAALALLSAAVIG